MQKAQRHIPGKSRHRVGLVLCAVLAVALGACGGGKKEKISDRYAPIALEGAQEMRVNAYLWRAALDTLDFMSVISTDATGGVIVTDWYANPSAPNDRMKVTVRILDPYLRADALDVGVVRETLNAQGTWLSAPVKAGTVAGLEDAILLRARQIRIRTTAK